MLLRARFLIKARRCNCKGILRDAIPTLEYSSFEFQSAHSLILSPRRWRLVPRLSMLIQTFISLICKSRAGANASWKSLDETARYLTRDVRRGNVGSSYLNRSTGYILPPYSPFTAATAATPPLPRSDYCCFYNYCCYCCYCLNKNVSVARCVMQQRVQIKFGCVSRVSHESRRKQLKTQFLAPRINRI